MIELIRKIRNQTGAGVIDIKKALEEVGGDEQQAIELLRRKGLEKAGKKEGRDAKEGAIATYVHSNKKVAALVKLLCETDFVARNEEFQQLANDLAMQVVAMAPLCVRPEDVPANLIDDQRQQWERELAGQGKSAEVMGQIMKGKEQKFRSERALLTQAFIKDQDQTVDEMIKAKIAKIGENIVVGEFVRIEL